MELKMSRGVRRVGTGLDFERDRPEHSRTMSRRVCIGIVGSLLALGAAGLTVAKVGEAEVMLGAAPRDLLVAYPVFGEPKPRRLAAVAGMTNVTIALRPCSAAERRLMSSRS